MRFPMVTLYPKPTLASKDPKSGEMRWLFRLTRVSWIQRFGALLRSRTYHSPILDRCGGEGTKIQLSLVKLDAGHILRFLVAKQHNAIANRAIHRMATRVTPDAWSLSLPAIGRATATHR
jgi:hypothetical protein